MAVSSTNQRGYPRPVIGVYHLAGRLLPRHSMLIFEADAVRFEDGECTVSGGS